MQTEVQFEERPKDWHAYACAIARDCRIPPHMIDEAASAGVARMLEYGLPKLNTAKLTKTYLGYHIKNGITKWWARNRTPLSGMSGVLSSNRYKTPETLEKIDKALTSISLDPYDFAFIMVRETVHEHDLDAIIAVREALLQIKCQKSQQALFLKYWKKMKEHEAAEAMNVSEPTLQYYDRKGRKELKRLLDPTYGRVGVAG